MASSPFGLESIAHYHFQIKKNYLFSLKHFFVQTYLANHPKLPNGSREKSHSILGKTIFENNVQLNSKFFMVYMDPLQKNANKPCFQVKCKLFHSLLKLNKIIKAFNIVDVFEWVFSVEISFLGKI